MRAVLERRTVAYVACLALAVVCCACGSGPADHADGAARHGAVITVGSFDFPESVLLADIYAGALTAQGFPVRVLPNLGPRELVDPALMSGLVQVVPEYSGSALEFLSVGRLSATSDAAATGRALAEQAAGRGLVAGRPSAAQDANVIVVTAATAARYGVTIEAEALIDGEHLLLLVVRAASQEAVERFLREARASARLKSDHVVKVHDVGRLPGGAPYMVMEYLKGRDLGAELEQRGPLPVAEAALYLASDASSFTTGTVMAVDGGWLAA